jgi:hypothetical protein
MWANKFFTDIGTSCFELELIVKKVTGRESAQVKLDCVGVSDEFMVSPQVV